MTFTARPVRPVLLALLLALPPASSRLFAQAAGACEVGRDRQSPIDIAAPTPATLPPLSWKAEPVLVVKNTGKSAELTYRGGSLSVGTTVAVLKEAHFHRPAEHRRDGKPFPMEVHLVHEDEKGDLHVLGAWMAEAAEPDPAADALWRRLLAGTPREEGKSAVFLPRDSVSVYDLLPKNAGYDTYDGSLTTPPFTQRVTWYVLKTPARLPSGWVSKYAEIFTLLYSRDVQPLCGRTVRSSRP